jgi:hypothetical protein
MTLLCSETGRGLFGDKEGDNSSFSGPPSLLEGVLKGDDLSLAVSFWLEATKLLVSEFIPNLTGLFPILGFSARLTGGGPGFCGASRLCSPDLLGGGGEGGCEGGREFDLPGSRRGVFGLLEILKCLGEDVPGVADNGASMERCERVLDNDKFRTLFLGGDCGGSIVTEGVMVDSGRYREIRVGEGDGLSDPFVARCSRKPPVSTVAPSLPLAKCVSTTALFIVSPRI